MGFSEVAGHLILCGISMITCRGSPLTSSESLGWTSYSENMCSGLKWVVEKTWRQNYFTEEPFIECKFLRNASESLIVVNVCDSHSLFTFPALFRWPLWGTSGAQIKVSIPLLPQSHVSCGVSRRLSAGGWG